MSGTRPFTIATRATWWLFVTATTYAFEDYAFDENQKGKAE